MRLLCSVHNDDAPLFSAFAIQEHKPLVLTVYDSFVQPERGHAACDWQTRRDEDKRAMETLGAGIRFGGIPDNLNSTAASPRIVELFGRFCEDAEHAGDPISEVWLPLSEPGGHDQHNLVGDLGGKVFAGARIHRYTTYSRTKGRTRIGNEYKPTGVMVRKKLQAMAMYKTQLEIDALGCWPWFLDLREYYTA